MTEEIKKLIEVEAKDRFSHNVFRAFTDIEKNIAITEFKYGGLFVLSKWQEAERWRKVEEELPEVRDNTYFINIKKSYVRIETIAILSGTEDVKEYLEFYGVIEWKPIS